MSRRCSITGKTNNFGNAVSHSNRHTRRIQRANIQKKRMFIPELGKEVTLKLSTRAIRTLNWKPLPTFLKENGLTLADLGIKA